MQQKKNTMRFPKLKAVLASGLLITLSLFTQKSFSQSPGLPGNGGGNSDTPLGVPIDWKLDIILLAAGLMLALTLIKRLQKKQQFGN